MYVCFTCLDISMTPSPEGQECVPVVGRADSDPVRRFGHSSVLLSDSQSLVSFGGFGEESGKHCRILDLTITDIKTCQSYIIPVKVNPREVQGQCHFFCEI